MKHISIIIPVGSSVIDTIIAPYNLLLMANTFYRRKHRKNEDPFAIDLVGLSEEPVQYQGLFSIAPTKTIDKVVHTDLIIVSAISGNLQQEIKNNAAYISWIKNQRIKKGSDIASLCKGAFLLAETGLLNGKSCSTHWTAHNKFRVWYPKVKLIPEKIISEHQSKAEGESVKAH